MLPLSFPLGFFTFIINAMRLKMVSGVVPGFYVHGFWPAVFGSLIISLVSWMPSSFLNERRQDQLYRFEKNGQRYLAITQSEL